jgi:hypothetical protein
LNLIIVGDLSVRIICPSRLAAISFWRIVYDLDLEVVSSSSNWFD